MLVECNLSVCDASYDNFKTVDAELADAVNFTLGLKSTSNSPVSVKARGHLDDGAHATWKQSQTLDDLEHVSARASSAREAWETIQKIGDALGASTRRSPLET